MTDVFPPLAVRIWMHQLNNGAALATAKLKNVLLDSMSDAEASKAVNSAVVAGVLVPSSKGKRVALRFCQKFKNKRAYDLYCYECHLSDPPILKECSACTRSFHECCQRKNPLKPNYTVPSDKGQPYRFPAIESDLENEDESEDHGDSRMEIMTTPAPSIETNNNSLYSNGCSTPFKQEYDDDDVVFVSEKPASARQRKLNEQIKREALEESQHALETAEADNDLDLCTACRLLKLRQLYNPPHMSKAEVCSLLCYSWAAHKSWLEMDARKYMVKHWNASDVALIKRMLFKNETLGVSDINDNIDRQKYDYLMEFLVDLLDLQHSTAVFFGTICIQYNATKWMMRDVMHDIREIRRCPDCFRYSSEVHKPYVWFAKPCRQRHELVYAKQSGFPHWPAKVIRVLAKHNKYDVRFFGGQHSRALIPTRDILPIDADINLNKMKHSRAFSSAMRELESFMALSRFSPSLFSFDADAAVVESIINTVLSPYVEAEELMTGKRTRPSTPGNTKRSRKTLATSNQTPKNIIALNVDTSMSTNASVPLKGRRRKTLTGLAVAPNAEATESANAEHEKLASELIIAKNQISQCKAEVARMKRELIAAKRSRWCQNCLQKADFDCCFAASYCTAKCQQRDLRRHQSSCRKFEM